MGFVNDFQITCLEFRVVHCSLVSFEISFTFSTGLVHVGVKDNRQSVPIIISSN